VINENSQVDIAIAVKTVRENLPAMLEMSRLQARLMREKYIALIKEGFTEEQALRLCRDAS
jgi:hypothetical protein